MKRLTIIAIPVLLAVTCITVSAQNIYLGSAKPAGYDNVPHHQPAGAPNQSTHQGLNPSTPFCLPCTIPEGEPDIQTNGLDVTNGGCNQLENTPPTSPVFTNISMGNVFCGRCNGYVYGGIDHRDTDWYKFVMTTPGTIYFSAYTTFLANIMILDGSCPAVTEFAGAGLDPGVMHTTTATLPAGTYYLLIFPQGFGVNPAYTGNYMVKLSSTPPGDPSTWCNPAPIPTLGQWGLIILGITLVAFGTFYIVRRG